MDVTTFAGVWREIIGMPTVWVTSEGRPRNLVDVLLALHERT